VPICLFGRIEGLLGRVPPHVSRAIVAVLALRVLVDGCAWLIRARFASGDGAWRLV
jgi:hypothetical protein